MAAAKKERVNWSVEVSKDTDRTLRSFLRAKGAKNGDRAKFIEDAVRWRLFDQTVRDIKERNANADPDELQRTIDEGAAKVRAERVARRRISQPDARRT